MVVGDFEDSRAFLRPYFERFLRFYRLYRAYATPRSRPWRANVFVPIPFASVEHGVAAITDAYSQRPTFSVLPREGSDYTGARTFEGYLEWEDDAMGFLLKLFSTTKEQLLYGTSWQKTVWDWGAGRNAVEDISVFNGFPDPYAESLDDAEFFIHRARRSPSWIRRMVRGGFYDLGDNVDVDAEIERMARTAWSQTMDGEQLLGNVGLDGRVNANRHGRIEVLEWWSRDMVVTVLNREKVVRAFRNRYPHESIPIARYVDHFVPHELMGIGELEVTERLFDEINDIRNQRLDVVSLALNNILLASRQAGIDENTLIWRPGQIVWANDINGIKPMVQIQGQGPALGVAEEAQARFDIQEATSNWGYNQGQVPNRRETATTVLALQRAGGMRFASKIRFSEHDALKRQAVQRMANAQTFMPARRWIRITNQEPVQISREDVLGQYDYIPIVSSAEPIEAKRAQLGQILPLLMTNPAVNDAKVIEWILDLYRVREKSHFLLSPEQMQAKVVMQAMARASGRGGLGAAAGSPAGSPTMIGAGGGAGPQPSMEGIADAGSDGAGDAAMDLEA